jgi:threonine synthase
VRGKPGIDIYILHPKGKVSPVQERQMTSVLDANVHNVAIEGTFDDAQGIVKSLFGDLGFKERYRLGAVNSINWARIAAQIVYYFYAWGRLTGGDCDKKLRFAVPTGNFGDIFAGHVARMMGLPVDELIIATNQNDILDRFVRNADYSSGAVHSTITPAMDIQVSSNFERYLYYLVGQESQRVAQLMAEFAATGRLTVTPEEHQRVVADFTSHAVDQETTLATIARYHRDYAYTLDPHTAVGVAAAERSGGDAIVCLATAHPAKFGEAVVSATGCEPQLPPVYADLMERETRLVTLPATAQAVRQLIEEQARTS